jgi:signal transduction histidine kinase
LVERVGATGLTVRMETAGLPFELSEAAGVTVFRIVQEALTNTLKHATAPEEVEVRLGFDDPEVSVQVTDNGRRPAVGAPEVRPAAAATNGGGHGITGMRERAAAFSGTLAAGPLAQGGWQVSATLHGRKVPTRP